jgi:hypothetical protein
MTSTDGCPSCASAGRCSDRFDVGPFDSDVNVFVSASAVSRPFSFCGLVFVRFRRDASANELDGSLDDERFGV